MSILDELQEAEDQERLAWDKANPIQGWPDLIGGVDVSTKRIAIVRLDLADGSLYDYTVLDIEKRADKNLSELARRPAVSYYARKASECRVVYFENPFGFDKGAVAKLNRVLGACQHATPRAVSVCELSPSAWKVGAGLAGNAKKDAIAFSASNHYAGLAHCLAPALEDFNRKTSRGVWEQDVLDAACIARAGYLECLKASNVPDKED